MRTRKSLGSGALISIATRRTWRRSTARSMRPSAGARLRKRGNCKARSANAWLKDIEPAFAAGEETAVEESAIRPALPVTRRFIRAHAQPNPVRPAQLHAGATGTELAAELHRTTRQVVAYGLDRIDVE